MAVQKVNDAMPTLSVPLYRYTVVSMSIFETRCLARTLTGLQGMSHFHLLLDAGVDECALTRACDPHDGNEDLILATRV